MKARFLLVVLLAVVAAVAFSSLASAQRGRGGGPGGNLGLLMNESVQKELDITPEQLDELRKLGEKMRSEMREVFSSMRDSSGEDRQAQWDKIREKMREKTAAMQKDVDKVLLPIQSDRLKQIGLQQQVRYRGFSGALGGDALAKELGLTDDQKEKLRKKAEEVQKKLQERIAKMREEAQDDLLEVLTPEQRAKIKKMLGDKFEMQQSDRRRGGPGGGGPGGGGQGGGRGR